MAQRYVIPCRKPVDSIGVPGDTMAASQPVFQPETTPETEFTVLSMEGRAGRVERRGILSGMMKGEGEIGWVVG